MTKYNKGQLPEFIRFREIYEIDSLSCSHIMVPGEISEEDNGRFERFVKDYVLPEGLRYHTYGDKSPKRCSSYKRTAIRSNGEMQLCCRDTVLQRNLGNVFEEGFFNVWRRNREIRERIRKKDFPLCTYCSRSLDYTKINKL